jgi:Flp pilus assembly protein TadB
MAVLICSLGSGILPLLYHSKFLPILERMLRFPEQRQHLHPNTNPAQCAILQCSIFPVNQDSAQTLNPVRKPMYIVAIAWLYVALMVAIAQPNITAGVITLLFWGVFPLALFLWIMGKGERRRRRALAEQLAEKLADQPVHHMVGDGNGGDAKPDQ